MARSANRESQCPSLRKRVLYVVQEYPIVTQTFVEAEALAVQENGIDVTVFAIHSTNEGNGKLSDVVNMRSMLIDPRMWRFIIWALFVAARKGRFVWSLFACGPKTIQAISRVFYGFVLSLMVSAYLKAQVRQVEHVHAHFLGRALDVVSFVKVVWPEVTSSATAHAADASNPESLDRLRLEVHMLDDVVSASKSVANALLASTGRESKAIVHCGIVPKVPTSSSTNSSGSKILRILSVGRTVEKKGYADCVEAAKLLEGLGVEFEWRIIGSGPLDMMLHSASLKLIHSGHMVWLGSRPNSYVLKTLETWADIVVLPSKVSASGDVDGIPVALMEAMTHCVVPVASRLSGIPELVVHGETGLLIEPGDIDGLVSMITLLASDERLRSELGGQAKSFVDRYFNRDCEAKKLISAVFDKKTN